MIKFIFKFMLFVLLFISTGCLSAQVSQTYEMQLPYPVSRTIVRELAAPISIVYAETAYGHYFIHNDPSGISTVAEINSPLSVSDFVVDGDSVFFCGNVTNGQVFFGFFHIPDFFFGSGAYAVDDDIINTQSGTVSSLSKMVSYRYNSSRQMAAVGTSSSGLPCVVHLQFNTPIPFHTIYVSEVPSAYDESMLDIALTDSYIVTAGFADQSSSHPYLSLRLYDINPLFFFNYCNTAYYSYLQNNEYQFEPNQLVSDKMAYNYISVASYYRYDKASGGNVQYTPEYGTYIGLYYVIQYPTPTLQHAASAIIPSERTHGGWVLHEITKSQSGNFDFFLLHDIERDTSSGCLSTIYELSYNAVNSPTPIFAKSTSKHLLGSIDNYNTTQHIASGLYLPNNDLALTVETPGGIGCLDMDILNPSKITVDCLPKDKPLGQPIQTTHIFKTLYIKSIDKTKANTICQQ